VAIAIEIAHRNVDRLHTNGETSRSAETARPSPNTIETLFELKLQCDVWFPIAVEITHGYGIRTIAHTNVHT